MLVYIWSLSILMSAASLFVMVVLILRRLVIQRRAATYDRMRQRLIKSLIAFSHDRDREALKRAIAAAPADVTLKAGFEFLSLLRGDEHDEVIATFVECGLPAEAERQLARGNGAARIHATEMLAALHTENAVPALLAALDKDRSRDVCIAAAIALCDLGALPPLDATLAKIGTDGQRSRRLIELFRRFPAGRVDELKAYAGRADASPFVRAAVIDALSRTGDFRLAEFFGHVAQDAPPEVTAAAVRGLGRTGHAAASAILARAMENDDWGVRHAAAEATGRLGLPTLIGSLARLLDDDDWTVRYAAAKAMRAIAPEGERMLREIAATQSSRSQRTASLILSEGPIAS